MRNKLDPVWRIMKEGFHEEFLRSYEDQAALFCRKEYHLDYIYQQEEVAGCISWWELPEFDFVEHIAISKECRGSGLGKAAMEDFSKKNKLIILEVELGNTEIDRWRIHFYERCGFVQNDYKYEQPPLQKKNPWVPLMIMSSNPLDLQEFTNVKDLLYEKIYNLGHENT